MIAKKLTTLGCILAMTVLITLGGLWQPAAAKSGIYLLQEGETIGLGRQGLHVTNIPRGVSHVYLDIVGMKLPTRFISKVDIEYHASAMEVRFLNEQGDEIDKISALVYVFINISRAERAMWLKSGMKTLAIWYANQETGGWEMCPTFFVDKRHSDEIFGRLACLALGSGYYVLGQGDFSQYLNESKAEDSSKRVQSAFSQEPTTLKIRAYIDGRSQLIIHGNSLRWHHLDFDAPGRWELGEGSQPTFLNQVEWGPTWPDLPDSTNDSCNCDSSSYQDIPGLASSNQNVELDIVQARGAAFILQQPSAANNYTLIIELDDNPWDGAAWYEVNLRYFKVD